MTMLQKKFRFQRADTSTAEHCCVPMCQASSKYNKVLSFHTFPADVNTRQQWFLSIRRRDFVVSPHTRVCSRHFKRDDFRELKTKRGRRLLKKGTVPTLFEWNNFSAQPPRPAVSERIEQPENEDTSVKKVYTLPPDHDYAAPPNPGVVDLALDENTSLKEEILQLKTQIEELTMKQRFGIHRFAGSDKDIQYLTRFASYDLLMGFWALIEPCLPSLGRVTPTLPNSNAAHSLQPIDEMFMFLNYLALGSKQCDLADQYGVHLSTINPIITTWSNFLYSVLGSVKIWMSQEKIKEHLPGEFLYSYFADTTVILDCMELKCQCPSSPLFQSEVFPVYKSLCALKGLLGLAPHGAVTFISPLYAGSIGDKQIIRESGILSFLRPGMAVMVDRSFRVADSVPCTVYRPAYFSDRSQMSAARFKETHEVARVRTHVEHLICRVKDHKFFNTVIPHGLFGNINQLYAVACLLTNYENGLLVKDLD